PGAPEEPRLDARLEAEAARPSEGPGGYDERGVARRDEPLDAAARGEGVEGLGADARVRPDRHRIRTVAGEEDVEATSEVVGDARRVRRAEIRERNTGRQRRAVLGLSRGAHREREREREAE